MGSARAVPIVVVLILVGSLGIVGISMLTIPLEILLLIGCVLLLACPGGMLGLLFCELDISGGSTVVISVLI